MVARVLVVGAGGLGGEVLKNLSFSEEPFEIEVVDMDLIEVTNLNRQFMFRSDDIGRYKAIVAVEWIRSRVPDYKISSHKQCIESFPLEFFATFHLIITCVDSLETRRWVNKIVADLAREGEVVPLIDGGSEGFKGHACTVIPGHTSCLECLTPLFASEHRPICTISSIPRDLEECIEWAAFAAWPRLRESSDFDYRNSEHVSWVLEYAFEKAISCSINTESLTLELLKNTLRLVIPAVSSTNSVIGGICSIMAMNILHGKAISAEEENFYMYNGEDGAYFEKFAIGRYTDCPVCRMN